MSSFINSLYYYIKCEQHIILNSILYMVILIFILYILHSKQYRVVYFSLNQSHTL